MCLAEGRVTQGVIVDHIVEIQDGGDLTSPDNLQTLCRYHHALKTKAERKKRVIA
jgi:5-methylcytosine-specific restriction protein A